MEIRAPYVVIGSFVVAVIFAAFGFVFWLHNSGGLGQRAEFRVRFDQPVAGLTSGSAVLFNGIRVGEVTRLWIERDRPKGLMAAVAVDAGTPVRADTVVDVDYQGLTGVAAISLKGGTNESPPPARDATGAPILTADPAAGQSLTQSARDTLRRIDTIIDENRDSFKTAISGIGTFADMLGRNSAKIEEMLGSLDKMLGGGAPKTSPKIFDLAAVNDFPATDKQIDTQIAVPDPTTVLVFDSQKILTKGADGTFGNIENAQWADNLPKLMQARLVQSFENAKMLRSVSRRIDDLNANFKLVLEIRNFQIALEPKPTAVVEFSARLLSEDGKVTEGRVFSASVPAKSAEVGDAVPALNEAFAKTAKEVVEWTVSVLPN